MSLETIGKQQRCGRVAADLDRNCYKLCSILLFAVNKKVGIGVSLLFIDTTGG
jgi:hypothetical protein